MSIPYDFNPLGITRGSGLSGMYLDGTALKGVLFNPQLATTVGDGADGSTLTNGSYLFYSCSSLSSWTVELPNLTNGSYMFYSCSSLSSFNAGTEGLKSLAEGTNMFRNCSGLTSWTGDLPNLTNGTRMFSDCSGLTSWTGDLPNLTNGSYMFCGCTSLTSFAGDLPKLTNGSYMFSGCTSLTSFNAGTEGLKSLSDGTNMFLSCILDETSVLHILNTIPTYVGGSLKLHLGKRTNYLNSTDIAAKLRKSSGATVSTPIASSATYRCVDDDGKDKGWSITV